MLTMDESRITVNWAMAMTKRANHRRGSGDSAWTTLLAGPVTKASLRFSSPRSFKSPTLAESMDSWNRENEVVVTNSETASTTQKAEISAPAVTPTINAKRNPQIGVIVDSR